MSTVLVTGGTGLLGRRVAEHLAAAGHVVRILSRRPSAPASGGARVAVGDLRTGQGLEPAVRGTTAIVHCASDPRDFWAADVEGTRRLLAAARAAGEPHLIFISIVGVDRIPYRYYQAKLAVEQDIEASGLPWTTLRTTQFHEFSRYLLGRIAGLPVLPVPRGWRIQPVDVDEVARRLVAAVTTGPAGRLLDLGGPDVLPMAEMARSYLRAINRRRVVIEMPVPGAFSTAMRDGANLAPANRAGGRTWAEYLTAYSRQPHRSYA